MSCSTPSSVLAIVVAKQLATFALKFKFMCTGNIKFANNEFVNLTKYSDPESLYFHIVFTEYGYFYQPDTHTTITFLKQLKQLKQAVSVSLLH
jgi:hypothetical protein